MIELHDESRVGRARDGSEVYATRAVFIVLNVLALIRPLAVLIEVRRSSLTFQKS